MKVSGRNWRRSSNVSKAFGDASLNHWSGLYLILAFALISVGIFYFAFATELKGSLTDLTVYTVAGTCGVFGGLLLAALAALG